MNRSWCSRAYLRYFANILAARVDKRISKHLRHAGQLGCPADVILTRAFIVDCLFDQCQLDIGERIHRSVDIDAVLCQGTSCNSQTKEK